MKVDENCCYILKIFLIVYRYLMRLEMTNDFRKLLLEVQ